MNSFEIHINFPLKKYNTFGIAATADRFVPLRSVNDYSLLLQSDLLKSGSFFILGGGSNVVLSDRFEGTVIHPENKGITLLEKRDGYCFVEAAAGELWADFVDFCIDNGWYGLENMAGIPGTVGAAPVQNVGAYGKEAKDVIDRVHAFDIQTGEELWIDAGECEFDYRWSRFKGEWKNRFLIDRVVFRLYQKYVPALDYKALVNALAERALKQPSARQLADTVVAVRDSKLPNPKTIGSAGSFFKNPIVSERVYKDLKVANPDLVAFQVVGGYKLAAGWLIEHCGWKGRSLGNAGVYEKQALVLVNRGECTGSDVRRLADAVIADVEAKHGVKLECEAIFV